MFRTSLRRIVAALAFTMFLTTAAPALAAPGDWKSIDVTLQTGEQKQSELIVSGEIPSGAKLPFEGELAVPAGTQMRWIGQILGGPVSEDPELQYTKSVVKGMDVYRFTLTKSRTAQFEGNAVGVTSFDGATYSTVLKWTAWRQMPEVHIRERLPQGAQVSQPAEGAAIEGDGGAMYYTKVVKNPKAGEVLDLTFSYTAPAVPLSAGTSGGSGSSNTALTIILTLVAAGFVVMMIAVWSKMAGRTAVRADVEPARSPQKKSQTVAAPATKPSHKKSKAVAAPATKPSDDTRVRPRVRIKPAVVLASVLAVLVIGVAGAVSLATAVPVVDGKMTKFFGSTSPCNSTTIPVVANQGVDLAAQGGQILDAFTGLDGVGDVTVDVVRSTVDVAFCESSQSEDSVRSVLAGTGLISLGASAAASVPETSPQGAASVDSSGKTQTASVDTASGTFSPAAITLKAGIPAEIAFGQGSGCISEVVFPDLNIRQSLEGGSVKIKIPALEPGTYAFACGMDMQRGTLVVK